MANLCSFELHARVKITNKNLLFEMEKKFDLNNNPDAFWVVDVNIEDRIFYDEYCAVSIWGECKWAVNGPFLDELKEFINDKEIDVEIYSEELGCGFQEHYKWLDGQLVADECVDTIEFHLDDIAESEDDESDYLFDNKLCKEAGCTKTNYQSFADEDGYIKLGGFSNWDFEY